MKGIRLILFLVFIGVSCENDTSAKVGSKNSIDSFNHLIPCRWLGRPVFPTRGAWQTPAKRVGK